MCPILSVYQRIFNELIQILHWLVDSVIFSEQFDKNRIIILQVAAKWRCIKLCAIFFWTTLYITDDPLFDFSHSQTKWEGEWISANCRVQWVEALPGVVRLEFVLQVRYRSIKKKRKPRWWRKNGREQVYTDVALNCNSLRSARSLLRINL